MCGTYLEFTWHYELWSVHTDEGVHAAEEKNGQDDGEVTDELPHLEGGNIQPVQQCFFQPEAMWTTGSCDLFCLFDKESQLV